MIFSCLSLLVLSTSTSAFVGPRPSLVFQQQHWHQQLQQLQQQYQQPHRSQGLQTVVYAQVEDEEEDEPLSDELSRLIGKRASISSQKASSPTSPKKPASILSDNEEGAIIDPSFEAMYEGKSGMDIFEMPEFKSKRPLKTPKETEDKARGGAAADGKDQADDYIDFMADYDDENDLHIPNRIGVSTVAWGDIDQGFKAGKKLKKKEIKAGFYLAGDLQVAFDKLMEAGITFMDTSESYGVQSRAKSLSAEHILCQCMDTNAASQPIIASAMASPLQSLKLGLGIRAGQSGVFKAIEGSAERLGSSSMDLYQVPTRSFYPGPPGVLAASLTSAMDSGLINNVGISTTSKSSMKRFNNKLNKIGGYQLTSNAFDFSLVNRKGWKSGLIATCKQEGIIPIARNPLGDGLASGVWTATNPTGGEVSKKQPFDFKTLEKYTTLHDVLQNVQKKVKDRLEKQNREMTDRRNRYGGPPVSLNLLSFTLYNSYSHSNEYCSVISLLMMIYVRR